MEKPNQILRAGVDNSYLSKFALSHCRTPSGHPEGFIEDLLIFIEISCSK